MNSTAAASFSAASPAPPASRAARDGQQRAQPLAAGGDQVFGQRRDHRHRALHALEDQSVDPGHIGFRQADESLD